MPFSIIRADITTLPVDAIVNAANETLLGGGGVDGAIHRAAGPRLLEECRTLGGCKTGEAKITRGYDLPAKYVIHTVGPIWQGGGFGEEALLTAAYRNSLLLAAAYHCESVAFPLISSGVYGYPKAEALRVATDTISAFLSDHEMQVTLVIFDKAAFQLSQARFAAIESYIDQTYVDAYPDARSRAFFQNAPSYAPAPDADFAAGAALPPPCAQMAPAQAAPRKKENRFLKKRNKVSEEDAAPSMASDVPLADLLDQLDEGFSETLLRKIDERGMKDSECYKRANIDRKLFSKIRSNPQYRPSKATALAFAVALELPLRETNDLLRKAGYALSHASKFDVIVEYFIRNGNYNIFEINEALFAFDQVLLGG